MHGTWDDVENTWDSWTDEFRWDFNIFNHSGAFSFGSGVTSHKTDVIFDHVERFPLKSSFTGSPAGSTYHLDTELKMRTRLKGLAVIDGTETLSLGSKSGLEKTFNEVTFSNEVSLNFKSGLQASGVLVILKDSSFLMGTEIFAGTGSLYFESVTFKGSSSVAAVGAYEMNNSVRFELYSSLAGTEIIDFAFNLSFGMALSYTVKDGWWVRPAEESDNAWSASSSLKGDWTADTPPRGNGWDVDDFKIS